MEQTKYDVFISYSRKDYVDEHKNVIPGNEVSKIKEALTEAGITYWFDEEGVYSGDAFAKIIVRSIKASTIFIFLSTENSNKSEWTANEISTAHMYKKTIIPVRIDDSVYHDDVILYISRLSHIDYKDNPAKGRQELIRSINSYLEQEKLVEAQKAANEKRRQEELEFQRIKQEEEKKRQAKIAEIESEIAALESQKIDRQKSVLQKEQELRLAQVDLEACEKKIQKLQKKLEEVRDSDKDRKAKEEEKERQEYALTRMKSFTIKGVPFNMVSVRGGTYDMGASKDDMEAKKDEKPIQKVTLQEYYIGETPVTQALWKSIMGVNPSPFTGDNLPVTNINWYDCKIFIRNLNEATGYKFRLPTEAEWEYAARGGYLSKGFRYSGANRIGAVGWYLNNSDDKPHRVKEKQPNELGLYDMSGNVWEWCEDWHGDYSIYVNVNQFNPKGCATGSSRVLRGGCWYDGPERCRVTSRDKCDPDGRDISVGLRLALVLDDGKPQ